MSAMPNDNLGTMPHRDKQGSSAEGVAYESSVSSCPFRRVTPLTRNTIWAAARAAHRSQNPLPALVPLEEQLKVSGWALD
jgi:hypothetical protein